MAWTSNLTAGLLGFLLITGIVAQFFPSQNGAFGNNGLVPPFFGSQGYYPSYQNISWPSGNYGLFGNYGQYGQVNYTWPYQPDISGFQNTSQLPPIFGPFALNQTGGFFIG